MEGNPKYDASQSLPDVPYHKFAELIGLRGIFVDDPAMLGDAWSRALAADRPTVLEVKTDPEVPPLPPHIDFSQARNFIGFSLKGDSAGTRTMAGAARQVLANILPGAK